MNRAIILMLACCALCAMSFAQDQASITAELKKLTKTYMDSTGIAFEVEYKYADANEPGKWLDSLQGRYKIRGRNYWYVLDSTEAIGNQEHTIVLFREDKIMYLARPFSAQRNPLSLIDSFMIKAISKAQMRMSGSQRIISLQFNTGYPCRSAEYFINAATGYIEKITQVVPASQLYDAAAKELLDNADAYAIVQVEFRNYSKNTDGDKLFLSATYFKKEGNGFVTVAPYESYKIFLGSPDLK